MVAQKYGNADKDLASRVGRKGKTKEIGDKPLRGPGTDVKVSAMVGGVGNIAATRITKKMMSGRKTAS